MATPWQIGDRLQDRWEIHHILHGGMGIVYIVYDHEFRESFAAKTFQDDIFAGNPAIADRFTQEALAWVNLDVHQNVTRARFVVTIGSKPFLFLEYVSGGDLGGWIGTPRLTEDLSQVLGFAIQFCDGMTHALAKGIKAHHDIKLQNCLITQDDTLKVTDFGLAKTFNDASPPDRRGGSAGEEVQGLSVGLSRTGTAAGTCTHMAPEQFDDAKHVDVRADVYAFGVMLFQMVTGKLPFVGRTWQEFKSLHQTQAPPPLPNSLHPILITVVHSCLAKDPARRFADFSAVRERLAEIYKGLTGTHAPHPVVGTVLDARGWFNKGASLATLRRFEEALACFDHVLALDPRDAQVMRRLALLYDLPLQFAAVTHLDTLLQTIVEHLVDVIPGAARGALLLTDRTTGQLLLKAHLPVGNPAVSLTLARRAMKRREGLLWRREEADLSASHLAHRIASAMYAPLLWQGEALGAVGMQAAMREVNAERTARGLVTCGIGIGVHCGQVVHGFIGALERLEFTVIGDAVNRAARYCDGAKPGEVLLSPEVHEHVWTVVPAVPTTIATKHEWDLKAYRIERLKACAVWSRPGGIGCR